MDDRLYDVVIVGAGPAGLSAAIMLGRAKRSVLVLSLPDRRNSSATTVHNVPFADGATPAEVYARMEGDAQEYGVGIRWEEVLTASTRDDHVIVEGALSGPVRGRRLLLATGRADELPSWLPDGVWGRSVFDCPYCHTHERDDGAYVCVGHNAEALKLAALTVQYARELTVVVSDPALARTALAGLLAERGVTVLVDTVAHARVLPSDALELKTASGTALTADTLLLADVARARRRLPEALGLDLTDQGFPETTLYGLTSDPLVYSAGNVEGSPYFMWTGAAGSGINAARMICEDLAFTTDLTKRGG
ncbi:NAD(P)/FAD-dependent oxidoreductase [Kitasatospora sp. NPDC057904]|uniref:NAD(P)/FAD-dependent oxidoreductase n=1 Tax=Kitasatospora sp. NPDC057904 TaxID=3346275 RepID=UPI0036DD1375